MSATHDPDLSASSRTMELVRLDEVRVLLVDDDTDSRRMLSRS